MTKSILDCKPDGITLRDVQRDCLLYVEKNWDNLDSMVLKLPVAAGKSIILLTIANWVEANGLGRTAGVTPTVQLQEQYIEDFPHVPMIKGMARYECLEGSSSKAYAGKVRKMTCGEKIAARRAAGVKGDPACGNCPYRADVNAATRAKTAFYNFHSLIYVGRTSEAMIKDDNVQKNVLILDEGHNTTRIVTDMYSQVIWSEDVDCWPKGGFTPLSPKVDKSKAKKWRLNPAEAADWIKDSLIPEVVARMDYHLDNMEFDEYDRLSKYLLNLQNVSSQLVSSPNDALVYQKKERYTKSNSINSGKYIPQLYIKPFNIRKLSKVVWPGSVDKVIMLSATISEQDTKRLGLDTFGNGRVGFYDGPSPIPKRQRPLIYWPIGSMTRRNREESIPKIVQAINTIASNAKNGHDKQKGVIHCTYEIAETLRTTTNNPRFMFHGKGEDKLNVYKQFLETKEPKILVASGMSEGVSLKEDLARWQVICMVVRPSLADEVAKHLADHQPEMYVYESVRTLQQAYGRVCRTPTDYGVTYLLDSSFGYLYKQAHKDMVNAGRRSMFEDFFLEAIYWNTSK